MPHVDEGTINALLDGELNATEVGEVESHLATCAACAARFQEARRFAAEAEQLVGALQAPPARRSTGAGAATPPPADPATSALEPIVLIPMPQPRVATRRRSGVRWIGWAALLFVALGAGIIAQQVRKQDSELSRVAPLQEYAVSPQEASVPAETSAPAPAAAAPPAAAPPTPASTPPRADEDARAQAVAPEPPPAVERESSLAARDESAERRLSDRAAPESVAAPERIVPPVDAGFAKETQAEVDRRRAAAAMATLDLDRKRAEQQTRRPASETVTTRGSMARDTADAVPAPAPVPAGPPPISERARTYLRIGLDEAARQLGSPLHVIEGMRPEYIGLALGRVSPGADTTRPVVRVVYLDANGQLILLDQQRIRRGPDGPRPSLDGLGGTRVARGDVWIGLSGEVGASELRDYAGRVH